MRKKKESCLVNSIFLEGNNGGDYIKIEQTQAMKDDNTFYIEVGSCCVIVMRGIYPVELMTSILTNAVSKDDFSEFLQWNDDFNKKVLSKVKPMKFLDTIGMYGY